MRECRSGQTGQKLQSCPSSRPVGLVPAKVRILPPALIKFGKMAKTKTISQKIKSNARRSLNKKVSLKAKTYVIDTSVVVNKSLLKLIRSGMKGKIIIPNAVIAELENMANKGNINGFTGLEEIAKLHELKKIYPVRVLFKGNRPSDIHIKYAKSGEIDSLIRELAFSNKATLVTADLVQAKSAQAYGVDVLFLKLRKLNKKKKRRFLLFKRKSKR